MTSTVKTVTRQQIRRDLLDIDPKVAVLGIIVAVCDATLVALYLTGHLSTEALATGVGPASVGAVAAYVKTSSHGELVDGAEKALAEIADIAPVAEQLAPAIAPEIETAEDIAAALSADLSPAPAAPATSTL